MSDTDKLKGTTSLDLESSTTNEADRGTQIKKRFNFWTAVGIAVCTSGAWEGWTASIAQGLLGGGSVGLLWGWVFVSVGILCMGLALAEFVSMWPLAGGQYVWAAKLAPPQLARLLSWFTAWAALADPELRRHLQRLRARNLAHVFVLVIHVTGYFVLIGVLLGCSSNKHDAKFVFTDFQNHTGWDSNFVSWSVSLLAALYAFFSLDSASHFSEEIPRANVFVPRAMCLQVVGNSLMTFPFIIVVLFCIGDIDAVLQSPIGLMSPFTQIIVNSTNSIPAGIILNLISTLVAFVAGCDLTGAVARAIWSMARDKALPQFLAKLEPRRNVPVWGNLVLVLPSILVYMIYIWNTTAFYGIMAGVLVAFQLSYIIPIGLYIVYAAWKKDLIKGPFNLGRLSYPCHVVAFIFGCFMTIVMSFPVYQQVTAANMNYASILVGAVLILSLCSWFTWGNKHYQGPLENSAHAEDDEDSVHVYPA
ncbi:hypothetical protein MHUMG1_08587 [Metarhizium humberi]|uniref:Amino acid/polyamine transporter I n=1 Tax=Metarhizium humberi TaxID=2596975 RepID=A0A9P8M4A6_9HYPO|nr:hypothetical protein MHUMG1_08587 [Metarhizium humberi]